ncbi:COX15/CtaA family protein [Vibrio agarilyticus]
MHKNQSAIARLLWLERLALILVVLVIVLGAYTRLSNAGLGCPDWPGCYGQLLVPSSEQAVERANLAYPERAVEPFKAWLEMVHRYFAGGLGLLVLAIAWHCFRTPKAPRVLSTLICAVITAQALLGMWTVTLKLMPVVVMAHLLGGFTVFVLLALLYARTRRVAQTFGIFPSSEKQTISKPTKRKEWKTQGRRALLVGTIAWFVLAIQILLGGWTSANYAALMCTTLPICQGDWSQYLDWSTAFSFWQTGYDNYEFGVLEYPARMTIHVAHRIGAACTLVVLGSYSFWLAWRGLANQRRFGQVLLCLLLVQVLLGVGNVVLSLPIAIAVAHNLVGALLLVVTSLSLRTLIAERSESTLVERRRQNDRGNTEVGYE